MCVECGAASVAWRATLVFRRRWDRAVETAPAGQSGVGKPGELRPGCRGPQGAGPAPAADRIGEIRLDDSLIRWRLPLHLRELIGAVHLLKKNSTDRGPLLIYLAAMTVAGQKQQDEILRLMRRVGLDADRWRRPKALPPTDGR